MCLQAGAVIGWLVQFREPPSNFADETLEVGQERHASGESEEEEE